MVFNWCAMSSYLERKFWNAFVQEFLYILHLCGSILVSSAHIYFCVVYMAFSFKDGLCWQIILGYSSRFLLAIVKKNYVHVIITRESTLRFSCGTGFWMYLVYNIFNTSKNIILHRCLDYWVETIFENPILKNAILQGNATHCRTGAFTLYLLVDTCIRFHFVYKIVLAIMKIIIFFRNWRVSKDLFVIEFW